MWLLLLALALTSAQTLTVTVHYPDANGVGPLTLRGDQCGLSWSSDTSLTQTSADTWTAQLSCDTSDVLMNFKVRGAGVWQVGANEMVKLSQSNSCVDVYPWFGNQLGTYQIMADLYSPKLNNSRKVIVYMPPSYQGTNNVHFLFLSPLLYSSLNNPIIVSRKHSQAI